MNNDILRGARGLDRLEKLKMQSRGGKENQTEKLKNQKEKDERVF